MENITINEVFRQMKSTYKHGTMHLLIAKHKLILHYSHNIRMVEGVLDGAEIEDCNYTIVHRIMKELSENEKLKIKLLNPHSGNWKKIRLDDGKLKEWIAALTTEPLIASRALGCTYLCEALYDICRKHIDGKAVDVNKTLKNLAKSKGIQTQSVESTIRDAVVPQYYHSYISLEPVYQQHFTDQWCSVRVFVRNFSHYILDSIYSFYFT